MFQELVKAGLVKQKRYPNGLSVFKYARKVFYDALWNQNPLLLEARGMVLDDAGNKVIWPFTKVFNYKENGAGSELSTDTKVIAPRKVNGFMAACRYWNGELIVSTTGTLDSEYATLARSHIEQLGAEALKHYAKVATLLFEICDSSDPHIIEEEAGAYLIGARYMESAFDGMMASEAALDQWNTWLGAKRPEVFRGNFGDLLAMVPECKHEGWMVIDAMTRETVMKIKSPHYLTKKFLMRMGEKKVDFMFDEPVKFREWIDEEYYDLHVWILANFDKAVWLELDDQGRRAVIEKYFEEDK